MKRKAIRSALLLIVAFTLLSGCGSAPQPNKTADTSADAPAEEDINNRAAEMLAAAEG